MSETKKTRETCISEFKRLVEEAKDVAMGDEFWVLVYMAGVHGEWFRLSRAIMAYLDGDEAAAQRSEEIIPL